MRRLLQLASLIISLSIFVEQADASIFVPAGLNSGDTYQFVFVTRGTVTAESSLIGDYDAFAHAQALQSSLTSGANWNALTSVPGLHAKDHAVVSAPVYRLDGVLVANGFDDFWDGTISNPVNLDQFGTGLTDVVWTGTSWNGRTNNSISLGGSWVDDDSGEPISLVGSSGAVDYHWIGGKDNTSNDMDFDFQIRAHSIYVISEVLTVPPRDSGDDGNPVPEPATIAIWTLIGLCGVGYGVRRRKGRARCQYRAIR